MKKIKKVLLIILPVLNAIVLLGQIWPEGAPAFAREINIIFLCSSLVFFVVLLLKPEILS